jgi:hypothetical protein
MSMAGFTEETLDGYQVTGFPRAFMLGARKPPPMIKYIVPGLRILDQETLDVTTSYKRQAELDMDQFLLFPSDVLFESWSDYDRRINRAQMWDRLMLAKMTGLYILPSSEGLHCLVIPQNF